MHEETIRKIEERIQSGKVSPANREKLFALLEQLKPEMKDLAARDQEKASHVADLMLASTTAALSVSVSTDREPLNQAVDSLKDTADQFGVEYPKLTNIINDLCLMLYGIGL